MSHERTSGRIPTLPSHLESRDHLWRSWKRQISVTQVWIQGVKVLKCETFSQLIESSGLSFGGGGTSGSFGVGSESLSLSGERYMLVSCDRRERRTKQK